MNIVWPFVLTFALVFGVLHKAKIFGDGKNQLNAIIAAVVAIIFISFASAVNIVQELLAFMVVGLIILLVFMMLFGFLHKEGGFKIEGKMLTGLGYVIGIAVIIAVMYITGTLAFLVEYFKGEGGNKWVGSIIMIIIIIGAIVAVMSGAGKPEDKKKEG